MAYPLHSLAPPSKLLLYSLATVSLRRSCVLPASSSSLLPPPLLLPPPPPPPPPPPRTRGIMKKLMSRMIIIIILHMVITIINNMMMMMMMMMEADFLSAHWLLAVPPPALLPVLFSPQLSWSSVRCKSLLLHQCHHHQHTLQLPLPASTISPQQLCGDHRLAPFQSSQLYTGTTDPLASGTVN